MPLGSTKIAMIRGVTTSRIRETTNTMSYLLEMTNMAMNLRENLQEFLTSIQRMSS